ncbi:MULTISPECIES: branched-chain amino acid transaminase [Psychrilyobacter]|uniref:Branched-chain-amino-acid aminotransferase n=1 Tax=Psychrilyobacter piezotolerans TaxID=2293438 RepID=A0ABX9KJY8_9FUSO|nr:MULTISPECIES: branched-chain amino acid transaminase [Psychrilyobacter]MCS5420515.1 branched-chain amino acid transaminase [Psychrilyobacter sp. S5]NDI76899.1 branched-chain amino acid transaminase [Psychrilyobacter piezotolerans]RDE65177.1 branched-chain amino acid transaminase [Psychrilyobacter sp. S5]REI42747.1 branched-chain amino acid transaminase [Psychrilyobacter piezotolerans]
MINTKKIWMNGEMIDHDNANVHVLSHVMHYGTSFFEGIRAYKTEEGTAIFRLDEHIDRLYNSCKIYRTEIPYTKEEIKKAISDTIKINGIKTAYIRPLVYRGYNSLGVNPSNCPVETMIATWEWGAYLGEEALTQGVDVCVSSWRRLAPNTMPTAAKAGGNYLSSQLIKVEALENGYDEGIALDYSGNVSEGSGENLFVISNGKIYSPQSGSSALIGITRDSVITIARDLGYEVVEETISRESLYTADELFFSGTAAEITPIASVDKIKIGIGKRGPITEKIQEAFFEMTEGKNIKYNSWLTYIK